MEQLPVEPGQLFRPTSPERVLRGRDPSVRGAESEGAQGGPVGMQPVLPEPVHGQPMPTPDHNNAGYKVLRSEGGGRLHVPWGDKRVAGPDLGAAEGG